MKLFNRKDKNGRKSMSNVLIYKRYQDRQLEILKWLINMLKFYFVKFHLFFIKSGYLGLMMNPSGDFSLACSSLLGCFGFNSLCFCYITFYSFFEGRDLLGILVNFSFLKTSCWIFLWVDSGRYSSPTFFFSILR